MAVTQLGGEFLCVRKISVGRDDGAENFTGCESAARHNVTDKALSAVEHGELIFIEHFPHGSAHGRRFPVFHEAVIHIHDPAVGCTVQPEIHAAAVPFHQVLHLVAVMDGLFHGDIRLPLKANELLKTLSNDSPASYAIRFAASFPNVVMVLSGMSNLDQMKDNISFMKDFKPINEKENNVLKEIVKIINEVKMIPCTNCKYCLEVCPNNVRIPEIFSTINSLNRYNEGNKEIFKDINCIKCGKCEKACPQHIEIRKILEEVKI